ncbi:hypothetical protein A3Q56_07097 [Intoshia linei]|uniref:SAM domain-containing protein n=1 Tax=Intoshia linei TaxID=1819745 RepID=A0A177AUI9_9BILA|nr:hypothetical protein A3Q56_07097 [Intoshia linei]
MVAELKENEDLEVWSSQRIIKWLQSIDLSEYSNNLKETGIHGYVLMNDSSFVGESFATALGIPTSKAYIRRHVITELEQLIKKSKNSSLKRRGSNSNLGSSFVKTLRFSKQSSSKDLKEKRTSLSKSITRRFRSTSNSNKD